MLLKARYNLLGYSPLLRKACVRQAASDKRFLDEY